METTHPLESGERCVRVVVQTKSFRCEATILVPTGGYRCRVLDLLNGPVDFIALTEVSLFPDGSERGQRPEHHDVLLLRKGEIEYIIPLQEDY